MSFQDYKNYTMEQKVRLARLKEITVLIEQIVNDAEQIVARSRTLAESAQSLIADID